MMLDEDERRILAWEAYAKREGYASSQHTYFRECFEMGWRAAMDDVNAQDSMIDLTSDRP